MFFYIFDKGSFKAYYKEILHLDIYTIKIINSTDNYVIIM